MRSSDPRHFTFSCITVQQANACLRPYVATVVGISGSQRRSVSPPRLAFCRLQIFARLEAVKMQLAIFATSGMTSPLPSLSLPFPSLPFPSFPRFNPAISSSPGYQGLRFLARPPCSLPLPAPKADGVAAVGCGDNANTSLRSCSRACRRVWVIWNSALPT